MEQVACDTGEAYLNHTSDSNVDNDAWPVGFVDEADQGRAVFTCSQPWRECRSNFLRWSKWVAHWNTFHMAVAPRYAGIVCGCKAKPGPAPVTLDPLFCHFMEKHSDVYDDGKWHGLEELVTIRTQLDTNPQYWPPSDHMGALQCPVSVMSPTAAQLAFPSVEPRWAARWAAFNFPLNDGSVVLQGQIGQKVGE